jgi:hypothetical protein
MYATVLLIQAIHLFVILCVLYGPLLHTKGYMILYIVLIPLMMLKWIVGRNTCVLTHLEAHFRGIDMADGFIFRILNPIFSVNKLQVSWLVYSVTIICWLLVLYNLITLQSRTKNKDKLRPKQ